MLHAIKYKRIIKIQFMMLKDLQFKRGTRICMQLNGTKWNISDVVFEAKFSLKEYSWIEQIY